MPVTFLALSACATRPEPRIALCETALVAVYSDFETAGRHTCDVVGETALTIGVLHEAAHAGPINPSPWYAMELEAAAPVSLALTLDYQDYKHRYAPDLKLPDGTLHPVEAITLSADSHQATLELDLPGGRSRLVADPQMTTGDVREWMQSIADHSPFEMVRYGTSADGRPLDALIGGSQDADNMVVALTRQHPPEVSGAVAFQAYVETLLTNANFETTRFVLLPLPNPDGIADGNWRHTSAGLDMNRDWFDLKLVETRAATDLILRESESRRPVSMLDFHSTHRTLVYSHPLSLDDPRMCLPRKLERALADILSPPPEWIPGHNDGKGTSKNWALSQFDIAGLTIELADAPPSGVAEQVGQTAANTVLETISSRECDL